MEFMKILADSCIAAVQFNSERQRALGRAVHALLALAVIALTGPWREGAFGYLWLAPSLVLAHGTLGLVQYGALQRFPDGARKIRHFTRFADPAVFAIFLCDAPSVTAFLAPYPVLLCVPVGLRHGLAAFRLAWLGMLLTLLPLLYIGHPFWRLQPQPLLALLCTALLVAAIFVPWYRELENRHRQDVVAAKAQALEAAMVARSAFLARASHQLRSPLQAIVSALELMDSPSDQAMRQKLIENISASAAKLSQELRDLLTLAQAEAWQLQLEPSAFDAGMLLDSVVSEIMAHPDYRGQRIVKIVPQDPAFLIADSDKIVQVLASISRHVLATLRPDALTLVMNARENESGMISFVVKGELDHPPGEDGVPSVENGQGLSGIPRQRDPNDHLVLTLVRTLVDLMGGHLETGGQPSSREFRVSLPCEIAPEDGHPASGNAGPRALVLAPQAPAQNLLAAVALRFPGGVEHVPSWPQAANRLAARPFGLLLVDMNLPRRGALRLATALRGSGGPGDSIRIIGFNARINDEKTEKSWPFDAVMAGMPSRRGLLAVISSLPPGKSPH